MSFTRVILFGLYKNPISGCYYYLYFTNEEMKAYNIPVACLGLHNYSQSMVTYADHFSLFSMGN